MPRFVATVVIGFVSGVLSGMFGIGGGVITTPAILALGAPALVAVGTPLPVILPSALVGAYSYWRKGIAELRSGVIAGLAGAVFAVGGAWLATRVGGAVVLMLTAVLILVMAVDMLMQSIRPPVPLGAEADAGLMSEVAEGQDTEAREQPSTVRLLAIGAITGAYSGFLGLGGGFVLVPLLSRWLRFPIKRAIATSLVTIAILAIPGSIAHWRLGNIDPLIALGLIVGVMPGAALGVRITLGSSDRAVRIGFAALLALAGIALFVSQLWTLLR
ncbi:MAG: sulfite exporter TauE/SafE family protein [Coriobacteriales bacterium]|nr:sulfite exporter TauE/SafE family protein [Coriobacteriales bacterium]